MTLLAPAAWAKVSFNFGGAGGGSIRPGGDTSTCDSTIAGAIRYTSSTLQYCNSSAWTPLAAGNTSGTVAAAGVSGSIQFNSGGILGATNTLVYDIPSAFQSRVLIGSSGAGYAALTQGAGGLSGYVDFLNGSATRIGYIGFGNSAGLPIYTASGIPFIIATSNTEAMRVQPNGNVGIGTAGPNLKLSVTGASAAYNGVGNTGVLALTTGTGANTDYQLDMGVVDGSYAWIQSTKPGAGPQNLSLNPGSGNVGIGTTSPGYKLDVVGNSMRVVGSTFWENGYYGQSASGTVVTMRITAPNVGGSYPVSESGFVGTDTNNPFLIRAGGYPSAVFLPTGNVGIGTPTPLNTLDIAGSVGLSDGQLIAFNRYYNSGWKYKANGYGALMIGDGTSGGLVFYVNAQNTSGAGAAVTGDTAAMRIAPSGNVGIGTGIPANGSTRLTVSGGNLVIGGATAENGRSLYVGGITDVGVSGTRVHYSNNNTFYDTVGGQMSWRMDQSVGGTTLMYLNAGGLVVGAGNIYASNGTVRGDTNGGVNSVMGIQGSTSGNAVFGQNNAANSQGYLGTGGGYGVYCAQGSCGGVNNWTNVSDIRLKEQIKTLPDSRGLALIDRLRPVTYHWRDRKRDAKEGQQIGFIAQDVEKLYPEMVLTDPSTSIKSLSYSEITVPLVKAVQELKSENDNLRAANDSLSRRLDRLEAIRR